MLFFFNQPHIECVVPRPPDDFIDGTYEGKNKAHEMYIATKERVAEENDMKKILTEHYIQETNNGLQSTDKETIKIAEPEVLIKKINFTTLITITSSFDTHNNGLLHVLFSRNSGTTTLIMQKLLSVDYQSALDIWHIHLTKQNYNLLVPAHLAIKNTLWHLIEPAISKTAKRELAKDRARNIVKSQYYQYGWFYFIREIFAQGDKQGNRLLHYALLQDPIDEELVKKLIYYYPAACSLSNNDGQTPIHLAIQLHTKPEILTLMLQLACSTSQK